MAFFSLGPYQSFDSETVLRNNSLYSKLSDVKQSISKGKEILQKNKITSSFSARNIGKAGILPQAFHRSPLDFRLQQKPQNRQSNNAQIPLKHSTG